MCDHSQIFSRGTICIACSAELAAVLNKKLFNTSYSTIQPISESDMREFYTQGEWTSKIHTPMLFLSMIS